MGGGCRMWGDKERAAGMLGQEMAGPQGKYEIRAAGHGHRGAVMLEQGLWQEEKKGGVGGCPPDVLYPLVPKQSSWGSCS
jgi:hypothetical protein